MPKAGDILSKDDVEVIWEEYQMHQKKFPHTPPVISFAYTLQNAGRRYTKVTCIEQEWVGTVGDLVQAGNGAQCPNGHPVEKDLDLKLVWLPADFTLEVVNVVPDKEAPDGSGQ